MGHAAVTDQGVIRNRIKEDDAMVRMISGVFCGAVVAALALAGSWYCGVRFYPLPTRSDFSDPESLSNYAAAMPLQAVACLLAGWALSAMTGAWVAAKICRPRGGGAALTIGALLTATVIAYASVVPHAEWITLTGLLLPIPFATMAALLAMGGHPVD
ncbi:MAG: hypothetical protein ABI858_04705 [Pseudoxanthomonas sp.]